MMPCFNLRLSEDEGIGVNHMTTRPGNGELIVAVNDGRLLSVDVESGKQGVLLASRSPINVSAPFQHRTKTEKELFPAIIPSFGGLHWYD